MPQSSIKNNGFTLIELISILIILSILATVAIPRLFDQSTFAEFTLRDQLVSQLQLVQQRAMNATPYAPFAADPSVNQCYWVIIKPDCFYQQTTLRTQQSCHLPTTENRCHETKSNEQVYSFVVFNTGQLTPAQYRFDIDGKIVDAQAATVIPIQGQHHLSVVIEAEGYIHGHTQE